jgi:type IV pilus assembly protein PilY1
VAYAGDLQGNLWAINIGNADPTKWSVTLLFQARDGSGNAQPITAAPSLTPNPNFPDELGLMVYVGTGRFIATGDLTSTGVQSFYGVWDNTSDLANYPSGSTPAPPYTRANLQSQTLSLGTYTPPSGPAVTVVLSTNHPVNLTYTAQTTINPSAPPPTLSVPPVEGWYYDLAPLGSGARSFTDSLVVSGGVQTAVNVPPGTACGTPTSYLMNVSYSTGGPFAQPSIGLNGGLGVGGSVNGNNPTGVQVTSGYSSAPTSIPTANGTNLSILNTPNGLKKVPTKGNEPSRVGWWQIH